MKNLILAPFFVFSDANIASLFKTDNKESIASYSKTGSKESIASYPNTDSKGEKNEKSNVEPKDVNKSHVGDVNEKDEILQILKDSRYDHCTVNINFNKYFNQ